MSEIGKTRLPRLRIMGDGIIEWKDTSAVTTRVIEARVSGDASPRFRLRSSGHILWGGGAAAPEAILYRYGSSFMRFNSKLAVLNGLGAGNSAAGNTLGNLVKQIEVFDEVGSSLGYIPIYDAITQV